MQVEALVIEVAAEEVLEEEEEHQEVVGEVRPEVVVLVTEVVAVDEEVQSLVSEVVRKLSLYVQPHLSYFTLLGCGSQASQQQQQQQH